MEHFAFPGNIDFAADDQRIIHERLQPGSQGSLLPALWSERERDVSLSRSVGTWGKPGTYETLPTVP